MIGDGTPAHHRVTRLVIRSPNWLGDAVMALPAMAALRVAYPEATLAVAAVPAIAPLFREHTAARPDEILTIERRTEAHQLRSGGFEAALLLPNSFRSAWLARQAGISQRWGYGGALRGWLLTRPITRPTQRLHQSARYLHLVRELGCREPDPTPRVTPTPGTLARASKLLHEQALPAGAPLIGLAPGAAYGHAKRWPPARLAQVVARLTREHAARCVLVGAGGDRDAGREIESALPAGIVVTNLIGRTDLQVLTGVLARCAAFVSNDSGAMHLAAAAGVPVTAIFGPTDERVTAPVGPHDVLIHQVFCRPCMLRDCPIDHRCMAGISVDSVCASVSRHLSTAVVNHVGAE